MERLEMNKKIKICICITVLILLLIISVVFLAIYIKRDTVYNVHYSDKSDLNYQVALKDNTYFETDYLEKDQQYIASLIDFISADFKYDLDIDESLEFNYKYKITANVNVTDDNTNKNIYTFYENLLDEVSGKSKDSLNINETVKIDYNKYNDIISEFVDTYHLKNVTCQLTVNMYLEIVGDNEELGKKDGTVISLNMPLTTDTVAIDIRQDLPDNIDDLITLKSSYQNSEILLKISIVTFALSLAVLVGLIIYIKSSETEEEKYNFQLKKILNNYSTYISKVEDNFDMKDYQILKVTNFIDLLEIRDTMHIPILMIEDKENLVSCFMIPTNNKILYFYSLGVIQYALPSSVEKEKEALKE